MDNQPSSGKKTDTSPPKLGTMWRFAGSAAVFVVTVERTKPGQCTIVMNRETLTRHPLGLREEDFLAPYDEAGEDSPDPDEAAESAWCFISESVERLEGRLNGAVLEWEIAAIRIQDGVRSIAEAATQRLNRPNPIG